MNQNSLFRPSADRISYRDLIERLELNVSHPSWRDPYPSQRDPYGRPGIQRSYTGYQDPLGQPQLGLHPQSEPVPQRISNMQHSNFQHPPGPMLNAASVYQQIQDDLARTRKDLYEEFRRVNYQHNEYIRREDFSQALGRAGLTLTVQQIDEIYMDCQRNRDGDINFRDFLGKMETQKSAFQQVQQQVARTNVNLYSEFKRYDYNRDEYIRREDFATALRNA